jgi:hypothetical protein
MKDEGGRINLKTPVCAILPRGQDPLATPRSAPDTQLKVFTSHTDIQFILHPSSFILS